MPNARISSAAVHIPELGDLVLGGLNLGESLRSAEILRTEQVEGGIVQVWDEIQPMIEQKIDPLAAYFEGVVYVKGFLCNTEILPISPGFVGQWTLIMFDSLPTQWRPISMCQYESQLFLCGRSYT